MQTILFCVRSFSMSLFVSTDILCKWSGWVFCNVCCAVSESAGAIFSWHLCCTHSLTDNVYIILYTQIYTYIHSSTEYTKWNRSTSTQMDTSYAPICLQSIWLPLYSGVWTFPTAIMEIRQVCVVKPLVLLLVSKLHRSLFLFLSRDIVFWPPLLSELLPDPFSLTHSGGTLPYPICKPSTSSGTSESS